MRQFVVVFTHIVATVSVDQDSRTLEATKDGNGNDAEPSHRLWVAGFAISLVSSVLDCVGINLQKYSLHQESISKTERASCHQPIWILGFFLICIGSIMDFVAFGMAPQTLLAPLGALSLVWNLLIAPVFHKETVTRQNLVATGIIFWGVTLTVIFAGRSTPSYDLDDLLQLYQKPLMYTYMCFVVLVLGMMFTNKMYIERTGIGQNGMYHIVCYGGIAGTFGGQSVLLAKSTAELAKTAIWGGSTRGAVFYQIETYLIVVGMVTCLICQIVTLNGGLERFDALIMVPVYQSFWILTSVLGGIMYFEEYRNMTWLQLWMFSAGGCITLFGIFYLLKVQRRRAITQVEGVCSIGGDGGRITVDDNASSLSESLLLSIKLDT